MKKLSLFILMSGMAVSAFSQLDRSKRPQPGPAPEVKLGKTESFTLANGLRVFVVENHKLPTISASIQLDVKPELEKDMAGYAAMFSELLTSGTKTRSNDKLNEEIDLMGASIRASARSVVGNSLKKYQDKFFDLMSDITINSDFKQVELDKLKKRTLSELEASANSPEAMLANVVSALNYGPNHPYGEIPTEETVSKITLEQCKKYYSTYFRPNVAYMAIVGDVTVAEVKPLIEKYFGKWQKATVPVATYSKPSPPAAARVAFVPRVGAVQSVLEVTYPIDLKPGTPDVVKARVANSILGGGSQGRLFLNLREKHSWTYGSYSGINDDDLAGSFSAEVKCRNAVSDSAIAAVISEMNRMRNEKVSQEDLDNVIKYMSGNFAIGLEDPARVAQYAINIERYNMPKDYYQNYLKNLAAVTAADVQGMATKYILPSNANIVVTGSKDDVAEKLAKFDKEDGKVEYYDNYGRIMKPVEKIAAPTNMTADAVMKKYVAAIGGEKVVKAIKDIKTVSSAEVQSIPITITEMKKGGDKLKVMIEGMGMVLQKIVLNGDKGYQEQQGQKVDMSAEEVEGTKAEADLLSDLNPAKYNLKQDLKGIESINGADAYIVEQTNPKGKKSIMYYDVKSGLLVRKVENEETPQGPVAATTDYSDYKEVTGSGGYKVPHAVKQTVGPQIVNSTVKLVEVNKGIADTEFQ
jgi:zinc protease